MKTLSTPILFLFFLLIAAACTEDSLPAPDTDEEFTKAEADFRWANWFDYTNEVLARESSAGNASLDDFTNGTNDRYIVFTGEEPNTVDYYHFHKDLLFGASRYYEPDHSDNSLYIVDFQNMSANLTSKMGQPTSILLNWASEEAEQIYQDQSTWGEAISKGQLSLSTAWENDNQRLFLIMEQGENESITMVKLFEGKRPFRK